MTGTTPHTKTIQQKLKVVAQKQREQVDLVQLRYAYERFLFRLAQSPHRDRFILKGGQLFLVWEQRNFRFTTDIDLLGSGSPEQLVSAFTELCQVEGDDGMRYDASTITTTAIAKAKQYPGIRIEFMGFLGNVRKKLTFDIGFDDRIFPETPGTLLSGSTGFSRALLESLPSGSHDRGKAGGRLKDYFDIWLASERFSFELEVLRKAIHTTFAHRRTSLALDMAGLSERFADDADQQHRWQAFIRKADCQIDPGSLPGTAHRLRIFLMPVLSGEPEHLYWQPGQGWQPQNPGS